MNERLLWKNGSYFNKIFENYKGKCINFEKPLENG
jgi:hypothetical protein